MKKNKIRVTESDLHNIIKESVKKIVNEIGKNARAMGQIDARNHFLGKDARKGRREIWDGGVGETRDGYGTSDEIEYYKAYDEYLMNAFKHYIRTHGLDSFLDIIASYVTSEITPKEFNTFLRLWGFDNDKLKKGWAEN